jgi:hypothetical protein
LAVTRFYICVLGNTEYLFSITFVSLPDISNHSDNHLLNYATQILKEEQVFYVIEKIKPKKTTKNYTKFWGKLYMSVFNQ